MTSWPDTWRSCAGSTWGAGTSSGWAALKAAFEDHGYRNVATYIQSGNVIFDSREPSAKLGRKVEDMLAATFGYEASVVLRSRTQMRSIVDRAPAGFGSQPSRYRYDVLFLKAPLTASAVIKTVPVKEGVDEVHAGPGVLYFSRLISKVTQRRLSRFASMPVYQNITNRNWNTTLKLVEHGSSRDPRITPPRSWQACEALAYQFTPWIHVPWSAYACRERGPPVPASKLLRLLRVLVILRLDPENSLAPV